jgi:hypothetical protein
MSSSTRAEFLTSSHRNKHNNTLLKETPHRTQQQQIVHPQEHVNLPPSTWKPSSRKKTTENVPIKSGQGRAKILFKTLDYTTANQGYKVTKQHHCGSWNQRQPQEIEGEEREQNSRVLTKPSGPGKT